MFRTRHERSGMSTENKPAGPLGLAGLVLLAVLSLAPLEARAEEGWRVGGAASRARSDDGRAERREGPR